MFPTAGLISSSYLVYQAATVTVPILQMRKLQHTETVRWLNLFKTNKNSPQPMYQEAGDLPVVVEISDSRLSNSGL